MENAEEFIPNFVPLKSSNVNSVSLLAASNDVPLVSNTVDRTAIRAQFFNTAGDTLGSQYLSSSGTFRFQASEKIARIHFVIPRDYVPISGTFDMSAGMRTNAGAPILSCYVYSSATATGAATYWKQMIGNSAFTKDNYGNMYLPPTAVTLESFGALVIRVNLNVTDGSTIEDGSFAIRYAVNETATEPTVIGNTFNEGAAAEQTAQNTSAISQNTSQLVYSQNETNGLLQDIIQHISDQLAAMWDQIYNLMAVPWIANDNQRTNNTISAIEENSENEQTTIIEQTQWHGNFIIEGLKGLFIPSDEYFTNLTSSLYDWFDDKFGFLGYTLTYFIRLLNGIMNAPQSTIVRFPGIRVPNRATNEVYEILPARDVYLSGQIGLITEGDFNLLEFMRTAGDICLVLAFVVMLQDKLREVENK